MIVFLKAYIKSMRLYYAFITGIAGWIGMAYYEHIAKLPDAGEVVPPEEKKVLIVAMLFLSWGINQIINDYLGLKEDMINAPHRPMVTGELDARKAILLSVALLAGTFVITAIYLEPLALIPAILGIVLNIVYEYAKGYGIIGNVVFGLMITMCCVYGFLASGPTGAPYFTPGRVAVLILVCVMNGLMTFYTYFKDYKGDKAADKRTIVVQFGLEKSRIIAVAASFLPVMLFGIFYLSNMIEERLNNTFLLLGGLTLFLELWTGYLYYKNPTGKKTYYSLATNFRACACGQASLIALFNTDLAMILFILSYIFIGFLFDLHSNRRA